MKTSSEYLESLKKLRPKMYMHGREVSNVLEDQALALAANTLALTYEFPNKTEYKDLMTARSHLTGSTINRFTHINQNQDDLAKKIKMIRTYCNETFGCIMRCMGCDALNALSIITHDIDKKHGTSYYDRFLEYAKYFQDNDLVAAAAVTDVKGDRSLRPHEQGDPDMYLRIVERQKDGIIVKGAKAHTTIAPSAHELLVLPTRAMTEKDQDYSVAFAVPVDAEGITMVLRSEAPSRRRALESPLSSKYNTVHSFTIFEDVFVPWNRVFMCGEWGFAGLLAHMFATFHRHSYCGCKPAFSDKLIGAAALAAEYNGIQRASHVRDKISDLVYGTETIYACGIAAAVLGHKTSSGTFVPDPVIANIGKLHSSLNMHEEFRKVHDIAGGLASTLPNEEDLMMPKLRGYMEKYLKGKAEVSTDDRIRCFELINDLTASAFSGSRLVAAVHGGGSPETQKISLLMDYDLERPKRIAKSHAGIEVDKKTKSASAM